MVPFIFGYRFKVLEEGFLYWLIAKVAFSLALVRLRQLCQPGQQHLQLLERRHRVTLPAATRSGHHQGAELDLVWARHRDAGAEHELHK